MGLTGGAAMAGDRGAMGSGGKLGSITSASMARLAGMLMASRRVERKPGLSNVMA